MLLHPRRNVVRFICYGDGDHRASDVADVCDARVDGYAQLKPRPLGCAVADGLEQLDACHDSAPSVLRTADATNKERHDLIADELVDDRVVAQKGLCCSAVEAVEQRGEVCCGTALAQRR